MKRAACPTCGVYHRVATDDDKPLPRQQRAAWEAIKALLGKGHSPSVREVACYMHVTYTAAHAHIVALMAKGYVTRRPGLARTLQITRIPL